MRRILEIINAAIFYLFFAVPAFAATKIKVCPDDSNFHQLCELAGGDVGKIVEKVVVILFIVAIIIALFFLIWGGIKWILSGGDKSAVEAARNTIIAAIVGLIIALAAFFILQLVLKFFGVDLFGLTIPSIGGK